jgi:DNA-binding CsgD family transcriptional regulator
MRYLFDFSLISCLTVAILTCVFAFALFFRYKSLLEYFFLAFIASFTLKACADAALIFLAPRLPARGLPLYALFFVSRFALAGTLVFIALFMHKLAGIFQSKKGRAVAYSSSLAIMLFFVLQFLYCFAEKTPAYTDPYAFFPVDLAFYVLPFYPLVVFLAFSRKIKNVSLYKMIRNLMIMIFATFPVLICEEIFGSVTAPFKIFPFLYLSIYLFLLFSGFRNFVAERRLGSLSFAISRDFAEHFGITAREKEIIFLMREGLSNKQIAERLFIATATVKNHVHNILEKTGAVNRVELIRLSSIE